LHWDRQADRIKRAADHGSQGGGRMTRPLVPGIPSRVVDPSGVVKQRGKCAGRPGRDGARDGDADRPRDGELIIGCEVAFKGTVKACDTFVVKGQVDASLPCRVFQVAEGGSFTGTAEVDEAVIAGTFEGTLTVRGRLTVEAPGRVQGKIRYGELCVQAGGEIGGDVQVGRVAKAASPPSEPETPARAREKSPVESRLSTADLRKLVETTPGS